MSDITLREVVDDDIPVFHAHQLDPVAIHMAAFTPPDPTDRAAFAQRWARHLADPDIAARTVLADGVVVGHVASYVDSGHTEVTYWIGSDHWGRGIATRALQKFIAQVATTRPLYARAVKDNAGSLRVLSRCGFRTQGEDRGFAHGRGAEVEEYVLVLEAATTPPTGAPEPEPEPAT
ncbi:GNAT family N-acetyltransferase [Actinopolymorpha pittospori]